MSDAQVTIIVGSYKQDQYIQQALYSARNQVIPYGYSYGGVLPSYKVVESHDYVGIGASAHRNREIAKVTTPWVIWLDADDLLPSHYLFFLWRVIRMPPSLREFPVIVSAPVQFIAGCRLDRIDALRCIHGTYLPFGMSCMFPKAAWEKVQGFDESLFNMNDLDFWLRLYRAGYQVLPAMQTCMFKRDVPGSLLKAGDATGEQILAQFNAKHKLNLKTKILPYLVPRTNVL